MNNKSFKIFSIATIVSFLVPMILSSILLIYGLINKADFTDHSYRLLIVIIWLSPYYIYFLFLSIYIIYLICIKLKDKIRVWYTLLAIIITILIFLVLYYIFDKIIWSWVISDKWLILSLFTLLILSPYIYLIVKKIQTRQCDKSNVLSFYYW